MLRGTTDLLDVHKTALKWKGKIRLDDEFHLEEEGQRLDLQEFHLRLRFLLLCND